MSKVKLQITNYKLQTDFKFQISKYKGFNYWNLFIWKLFIVCNLVLGAWNLNFVYAQDKIIAVVNNDIITQRDLNDFLNFMRLQYARQYQGKELAAKIEEMKIDILDKLIEDKLILQYGKKYGTKIEVSPKNFASIMPEESKVKAKLIEIKKRYPTEGDFQKDLMKQGLVEADIQDRVRDQLLMVNVIEWKIRSKITVTPEEVTRFYNKNESDFYAPETKQLEVYNFENADQASSFSYYLKTGTSLEDLATRYQFFMDKLEVQKGQQLRPDIEEVVFKLGLGEISSPLKIDDKCYVFRLIDIIPPRKLSLSEAQDKITSFLYETKMQEELAKWIDELKKQSYIKIIKD